MPEEDQLARLRLGEQAARTRIAVSDAKASQEGEVARAAFGARLSTARDHATIGELLRELAGLQAVGHVSPAQAASLRIAIGEIARTFDPKKKIPVLPIELTKFDPDVIEACRQALRKGIVTAHGIREEAKCAMGPAGLVARLYKQEKLPPIDAPWCFVDASHSPQLDTLRQSHDALELARAAASLCAQQMADSFESGANVGKEATALKGALYELRRVESDMLDLDRRRGLLVTRAAAAMAGGAVAAYLVRVLEDYEAQLAQQVEMWLGDPKWVAQESGARLARTREWARRRSADVRALAAKGVDAQLDAAAKDLGEE